MISLRTLQHRCAEGQIPGAVKQDGGWRIPRGSDTQLSGVSMPEQIGVDRLGEVAADKLEDAQRKAGIITAAEEFAAAAVREGGIRSNAIAAFCLQRQIGTNTFYRWRQAWRTFGIMGLVDSRGKGRYESDTISVAAFEWFKSAWLVPQQPPVKMIWQTLNHYSQQHGKGWQIPSLRTMYELVEKRIPMPAQILFRQGQAAYNARCAPYILTDFDSIQPGQIWTGDHHEFDCKIRHQGQWVRPWITAWQDMRSRAIVGHHISLSPNQTTIMLAFRNGCKQYGPPETCHVDNGKDYSSQMFTGVTKAQRRVLGKGYLDEDALQGLYAMMNIQISFAIAYHPQSKPIERGFATFASQFSKMMPTYCGPDTSRKPEDHQEFLAKRETIEKAETLESFTALFDRYVAAHNATAHTGDGMDKRSPNEVMATRKGVRVLVDGVLDLLCRVWSGKLTVSKNGVKFKNLWFGQYEVELMAQQGKTVRVSYDPQDLTSVQVYDETWNLITIAEQAKLVRYGLGADETALRDASAAKARARKVVKGYRDASRTANMNLLDLTIEAMEKNQRPDPEPTESPMLRPAATALDGQVAKVRQKQVARAVRKAAGAEQVTHVTDLKLDWRDLKQDEPTDTTDYGFDFRKMKRREETVDLRLFDNG